MTDEQTTPTNALTFTEAPASWNVRYLLDGYECQLTLRSMSSAELIPTTTKAIAWLKEHGAQPINKGGNGGHAAPTNQPPANKPTTGQPAPPAGVPAQPAAQPSTDDYEVIRVDSIAHGVTDSGHDYILVKGGKYSKFGVKCWKEAVPQVAEGWEGWQIGTQFLPLEGMEYAVIRDKKVQMFRPTQS